MTTGPNESTPDDLEITHEYGYDVTQDVISTFPGVDGGDGQPRAVTIHKPRP